MSEQWRDIPGFFGAYQVSSEGHVRSLPRVTVRSNGVRYRVRGGILAPFDHAGLPAVGLATGRRGHYRTWYVHKLVREVFGDQAAA